MCMDVNNNEEYKSPNMLPKTFSAFFWIIPLNNNSSANPVESNKIKLAITTDSMLKEGISGFGCKIWYSINPRNNPVVAMVNCTGIFPNVKPKFCILRF